MSTDATPLFDETIYVSEVLFSENPTPEPLTRQCVAWLPGRFLHAVASIAFGAMLTMTMPALNVSEAIVRARAVHSVPWSRSPRVPASILAAAESKSTRFVDAPHPAQGLKHPDID